VSGVRARGCAAEGDLLGDVQRDRGLAHRRAGGDDGQFFFLEPGEQDIKLVESGGHAGDQISVRCVDAFHFLMEQFFERFGLGVDVFLGDVEDAFLGGVDDGPRRVGCAAALVVGVEADLARSLN